MKKTIATLFAFVALAAGGVVLAAESTVAPAVVTASPVLAASLASALESVDPARIPTQMPDGTVDTATLMDHAVRTMGDDEIAEVRSFVMSADGRIEYVVLGFGGFLGIGEKDVLMPWSAFTIDPDEHFLRVAVSADAVKAMPEMATR